MKYKNKINTIGFEEHKYHINFELITSLYGMKWHEVINVPSPENLQVSCSISILVRKIHNMEPSHLDRNTEIVLTKLNDFFKHFSPYQQSCKGGYIPLNLKEIQNFDSIFTSIMHRTFDNCYGCISYYQTSWNPDELAEDLVKKIELSFSDAITFFGF